MQPVLGLVEDGRLRAVHDLLGDLLAVVRGQAVQDERLLAGLAHELGVDAVARRGRAGAARSRPPGPSTSRRRCRGRPRRRPQRARRRVSSTEPPLRPARRATSTARSAARSRRASPRRRACRRSPRRRAAMRRRCCRRRDRRAAAVERAAPLADRHQVGEDLARMGLVGQRVHDRHRGMLCKFARRPAGRTSG